MGHTLRIFLSLNVGSFGFEQQQHMQGHAGFWGRFIHGPHDVWTLKGDFRLKHEKDGSGTMKMTFLFCSICTLSFLIPENNS